MRADKRRMSEAPKITAAQLRQALATRAGLIVQDMADGRTYALPQGMTKQQTMDDSLVVVLTNEAAESYVLEADGSYAKAARTATTVLAWEISFIDEQLAAWAAR